MLVTIRREHAGQSKNKLLGARSEIIHVEGLLTSPKGSFLHVNGGMQVPASSLYMSFDNIVVLVHATIVIVSE